MAENQSKKCLALALLSAVQFMVVLDIAVVNVEPALDLGACRWQIGL
jgi:hypothetical protein